ncbi:MAG: hypothetical protein QM736_26330 [Vicinamibacterales bacterium]
MLAGRNGAPPTRALRAIAEQLPGRRRLRVVHVDDLEPLVVGRFVDPVEQAQSLAARRRLLRALRRACRTLPLADRRLLVLRFARRMSVSDIAETLGKPAKPLYRRLERIYATLRRALETDATIDTRRVHAAIAIEPLEPSTIH